MRGKRISTGTPKSGTEVIANRLLQAAGLNPDTDVQAEGDLPHVGCQEGPRQHVKVAKVSFTRPGPAWRPGWVGTGAVWGGLCRSASPRGAPSRVSPLVEDQLRDRVGGREVLAYQQHVRHH